jgi:hypothetical protein
MTILAKATGDLIGDYVVFVREYLRLRYDRWETVRSHIRKWPRSREAKSGNE